MKPRDLWRASLLAAALAASSCDGERSGPPQEPPAASLRTQRQQAISEPKVLILSTSVGGGINSREARAAIRVGLAVEIATLEQWSAKTRDEFMSYQALIVGNAACVTGTAQLQAAIDTRDKWGPIIDGNVVIIGADPVSNDTLNLVENGVIHASARPYVTGLYVTLGCAYRAAPAGTDVPLLDWLGTFKVEGVNCANSGHMFRTFENSLEETLSLRLWLADHLLRGEGGCVARSVFTQYPDKNFAFATIATAGGMPGAQVYRDYTQAFNYTGTPYVLMRGSMAVSAGCGRGGGPPGEQCDLGDGVNGIPATDGQSPDDTCSYSCKSQWCGDGEVNPEFGEECDDGALNGRGFDGSQGLCTSFCRFSPAAGTPPVAVCADRTINLTNACGATADVNNGSDDPDDDLAICTQSPEGPYDFGTTLVTLTCSDSTTQTASCTATVTVNDQVVPSLSLVGPASQTLQCAVDSYVEQGAMASDLCSGDMTSAIETTGLVNTHAPATYTVSYDVTDSAGNSLPAVTRTVIVQDTLPPSITVNDPLDEVVECGDSYEEPGAMAEDSCYGTLSDSVVRTGTVNAKQPGSYSVDYDVEDPAGNKAPTVTRRVTVVDRTPPTITCPGPLHAEIVGSELVLPTLGTAEARDACDMAVQITGPGETRWPLGTASVPYVARDASANEATCQAEIITPSDMPPEVEDWDQAFLGGGRGCAAAGGKPSTLALMALAVLGVLLVRPHQRQARRVRLSRSRATALYVTALAVLLASFAAFAQPASLPSFELERLKLNPSGVGSLLLGTGDVLPDGDYRFALTGHYENEPLVFFQNGARQGVVVRHRATAHLSAAYGLWGRLELGAQVPLVLLQRGDDLTDRGVAKPTEGLALGTPLVMLRLRLLAERNEDPVDLSLGVHAGPRLGNASALARELRATPSIMVGRRFGSLLRAAVDAGMLLRPRTVLSPDAKIQDELGHALRLGAMLSTLGDDLRGELAVIAAIPFRREGYSVETLAGARMPLNDSLEAYGLAGLGYGTAPGTPDFRLLLGMAYGKRASACVPGGRHEPETCPALDDDRDGVKNRDDACPRASGHIDAKGCPLRDSDGDGIEDTADRCPKVAGLAALQGCPDQDGDGVEDAADLCPSEPGPAGRGGCPPKDSDSDGLLDEQDACPMQPGIPEMRGCPPKDTDNDTVLNHVDNCPDEAGPVDNQGCPEREKQLVVIQKDRIEIEETVHFDHDKATIQSRSFALLDQVARVLIGHPEIVSVTIEGHTDYTGTAEYNRDLSQRRAEAVRDYLTRKGVAGERMGARGHGEDRPVQSNATVEGRAANRRVEFFTRYAQSEP